MPATFACSVFDGEQIPLLALAAGVADHAGGAADQGDRPMPGLLKAAQHHQRHQAAHVQAVGRGIEAAVERAAFAGQPLGQIGLVGRLVNQPAPAKVGEDVLQRRAFLMRHMSSSANGCAGPESFGLGRALRACSASRRSSRVVIFRLIGEPGTTVHWFRRCARPVARRRWPRSRRAWRRRPAAVRGGRPAASALPTDARAKPSPRSC